MSHICDIVFFCSVCEDDNPKGLPSVVGDMNLWILRNFESIYGKPVGLKSLVGAMGGDRHPQALLYGGSFNYFPTEEFIQYFHEIEFDDPAGNHLMIQDEDDDTFRMVTQASDRVGAQ